MVRKQPSERLKGGNVRGAIANAHLDWVDMYGGRDERLAIASEMAPEIATSEWLPFAQLVALDRAIYQRFGDGVSEDSLYEDLGRFSARANLGTKFAVWNDGQHHEFFEQSTIRHRQLQDFGTAEYRSLGKHRIEMRHAGYPCFSRVYCSSAVGFYEQCLISHGAVSPQVIEQTCQCLGWNACRFELRWR